MRTRWAARRAASLICRFPPGAGSNFAGLLTINLPATVKEGQAFKVVTRQIANVSARRPVPPPPILLAASHQPAEAAAAIITSIQWRKVVGTFQISIPVVAKGVLLEPDERLLSVLRWIAQAIPTRNRWRPVFERYLKQIADRVTALGGDPSTIYPSSSGDGRPRPGRHPGEHRVAATGKIAGLLFDRFGDFEGLPARDGGRRAQVPQPRTGDGGARRARMARSASHYRVDRARRAASAGVDYGSSAAGVVRAMIRLSNRAHRGALRSRANAARALKRTTMIGRRPAVVARRHPGLRIRIPECRRTSIGSSSRQFLKNSARCPGLMSMTAPTIGVAHIIRRGEEAVQDGLDYGYLRGSQNRCAQPAVLYRWRSDLEILIFPRPKASFSPVYAPVDHSKEPRSMERPRGNGLRPPSAAKLLRAASDQIAFGFLEKNRRRAGRDRGPRSDVSGMEGRAMGPAGQRMGSCCLPLARSVKCFPALK